MSTSESHRLAAIDIFAETMEKAGVPMARLKATELVDHIACHAVETARDLMRAEEGKQPRS